MGIEVAMSKNFSRTDLDDIKQIFNEHDLEISIGSLKIAMYSVEPPPVILIIISISTAWIVKPFFSGFFHKMGEDAYGSFKGVIKKISKMQKNGQNTQLQIHVKRDDKNRITVPLPVDGDDLKIALDTLPEFLDANPDLDGWISFDQGKWNKPRGSAIN